MDWMVRAAVTVLLPSFYVQHNFIVDESTLGIRYHHNIKTLIIIPKNEIIFWNCIEDISIFYSGIIQSSHDIVFDCSKQFYKPLLNYPTHPLCLGIFHISHLKKIEK